MCCENAGLMSFFKKEKEKEKIWSKNDYLYAFVFAVKMQDLSHFQKIKKKLKKKMQKFGQNKFLL